MVWLDYTLIGIIALSSLFSLARGLVREALSLVIWISAFIIAKQNYLWLSGYFTAFNDPSLRSGAAMLALFVASLIAGALVSGMLGQLIKKTGLSSTDRMLGLGFGAVRGVLLCAVLLFAADQFTQLNQDPTWQQSKLVPQFKPAIEWLFKTMRTNSSFLQST
ncbi:MAG: CvpA family protein [Aeromonas sp.]